METVKKLDRNSQAVLFAAILVHVVSIVIIVIL